MSRRKLPDTSGWLPRETQSGNLHGAFLRRCLAAEKLIALKSELESDMNIDRYDSGPGLEDIVREELSSLLPSRYTVTCGVVNDRLGRTAGDFDIVMFNDIWFPKVKPGATNRSRRVHFPIDGVYAVGELKSTIDHHALDDAMRKLVMCHRLKRAQTFAFRKTENREGNECVHGITNPLYSFVIAAGLRNGLEFEELVERFFLINQTLKRLEVIRALCVLGEGVVVWGYKSPGGIKPARFMLDDLYEPIIPILPQSESALFGLVANLMLHLYHSILAPEDVVYHYGTGSTEHVRVPTSQNKVGRGHSSTLSFTPLPV